ISTLNHDFCLFFMLLLSNASPSRPFACLNRRRQRLDIPVPSFGNGGLEGFWRVFRFSMQFVSSVYQVMLQKVKVYLNTFVHGYLGTVKIDAVFFKLK